MGKFFWSFIFLFLNVGVKLTVAGAEVSFDIFVDLIGWIILIKACDELMRYDAHKLSSLKTISTIALIINIASYAFSFLQVSLLKEVLLFGILGVFVPLALKLVYMIFTFVALHRAIKVIMIMQEADNVHYFAQQIKSKFNMWIALNVVVFITSILAIVSPVTFLYILFVAGIANIVLSIMLIVNIYNAKKAYEMNIQGV